MRVGVRRTAGICLTLVLRDRSVAGRGEHDEQDARVGGDLPSSSKSDCKEFGMGEVGSVRLPNTGSVKYLQTRSETFQTPQDGLEGVG